MRDKDRIGFDFTNRPKTSGFTPVGIFLFFGAMMASLAATTLLWRGTALDVLWDLNPAAYKKLAPMGSTVGILFLLLGAGLTMAGLEWFRRRLWGWRLAVLSSPYRFWGMSLIASEATCCAADLASSSPVHYCCFSCTQKSEPRLPRISSGEIQKGYNR
jgi:hypothetical protein